MNVKLEGAEVEVDVVRLDSDSVDEHLRSTAAVLRDILNSGDRGLCDEKENESSNDGDQGKPHPCQFCGKLYKSASTLAVHYRLKHPQGSEEAHCSVCDKSYASLLSLQKHTRYMHQYEHRCQVCYRTFPSVKTLQQHGETCVKTERPCPICKKTYNSTLSLRNHIKYKHPWEKTHMCSVCKRTFTSNRGLSNHVASMHATGLSCRHCEKTFNSLATLHSHFLSKHSESSARCTLCRKVLASQGNLTRHLAKRHDIAVSYREAKFYCGVCNSDFEKASDLVQHVGNCNLFEQEIVKFVVDK